MPKDRLVAGTLTAVKHDDRYEAPCGIRGAAYHACDDLPICCSYYVTVVDSLGKRTQFWAFWPRFAPGLLGLVPLWTPATFHLHAHYLVLPQTCSVYGCQSQLEWALDSDEDVSK